MNVHFWQVKGISFVTKWHATWVERICARSISMIVSRVSLPLYWYSLLCSSFFCFSLCLCLLIYDFVILISIWEQLGIPEDHLGAACHQWQFWLQSMHKSLLRKSQIVKHQLSHVSHYGFLLNSVQSLPTHFPTIGFLKTTFRFRDFLMGV